MSSAASAKEKRSLSLLPAILLKSECLSPDVRLLTLQIETDPPLEFLAGQSVRVEHDSNGKVMPLIFSIASPPRGNNLLELCVKPGRKGSAADQLCAAGVGSRLRISPPQGEFVLRESAATAVFLAAGTGIAPIRSMIHCLVRKPGQQSLCLIFGARDADSLFFHTEFADLARMHPNFRYIPVLSRPHDGWSGASGYVQHHLGGVLRKDDSEVYLCGPPTMIENTSQLLAELGWPEHLIHYERNSY
jgi:ferredoxin-NADP reductase